MKEKLKLSSNQLQRLKLREEFSEEYKQLNKLIRANAPTVYSVLKFAFYDVENGSELLAKKGLVGSKTNKYLDYIDVKELRYLVKGLKAINEYCAQPNEKFKGYPAVYNEMFKVGKKLRTQFYRYYKVYPEDYPVCTLATRYIKSATQKQSESFVGTKSLNTLIKEHELLMMEKARLLADMENIEKQISTMQEKENNAYNSNQRTK